jgi:hypothetical protein
MELDSSLLQALIEKLEHRTESALVYAVRQRRLNEIEEEALARAQHFGSLHGLGESRYERRRSRARTMFHLQENIQATVFHASGALLLDANVAPMDAIIASDADSVDDRDIRRLADSALERLDVQPLKGLETLEFERLWRLKATGITQEGKRGTVALTRVVGAYRRHIGALPVFGRASVFVEVAADRKLVSAGIDWRPMVERPIDKTRVVSPEEGAERVIRDVQRFDPERRITLDDYMPGFFSLGYFSLPKRRHQAFLQPAYVAMLAPTGPIPSTGRLVVVPAAPEAYEPLARPHDVPPPLERTPVPS